MWSRSISPSSMSRMAVASVFEIRASSAWLVRFSLRFAPEILSMLLQHALERTVLLEQLRRGLLADPRDARDVVRGVALEPHEVRDQLGGDAVAVDHRVAVVDLGLGDPAARGHHAHARLDQLEQVAVAGHDHDLVALLARVLRDRGDHVVGLVALDAHVLVAECVHERLHVRPLLREQVRLRVALRLVLLVDLLAARHPGVPDHERGLDAVLRDDLHEHRREAEDRVGGLPLRGRDGLRKREKRAINEAVPVDQEQLLGLLGHGSTLSTLSASRRTAACEGVGRFPLRNGRKTPNPAQCCRWPAERGRPYDQPRWPRPPHSSR